MIKGGLFLDASSVRQIYSPRTPSVSRIAPDVRHTTHISDAQPSIGVPVVNYSTTACTAINTAQIKKKTPIPDTKRIGA